MGKDKNTTSLERDIGIRIIQLRDKKCETQESLAASVGVSREIIQHWERGTRHIKADHIKALAEHFNVSSDYLLGLRDTETADIKLASVCEYTGLSEEAIGRIVHEHEIDKMRMEFLPEYSFWSILNELLTNAGFWNIAFMIARLKQSVNSMSSKQMDEETLNKFIADTNAIFAKSREFDEKYGVCTDFLFEESYNDYLLGGITNNAQSLARQISGYDVIEAIIKTNRSTDTMALHDYIKQKGNIDGE